MVTQDSQEVIFQKLKSGESSVERGAPVRSLRPHEDVAYRVEVRRYVLVGVAVRGARAFAPRRRVPCVLRPRRARPRPLMQFSPPWPPCSPRTTTTTAQESRWTPMTAIPQKRTPTRHSPHELAAYATDSKVPVQPDVYDQGMESMDEKTPIDLIYEDEKQTVIYTTTPDQKRVEMISGQLDDGQLVSSGGQLVDGGVSVVVSAPGQPTVLVLADHVVDELGQVITIPR